jgi:hypothetical protein
MNKDDANRLFAAISNAYEILSNMEHKREHASCPHIGSSNESGEESDDDEDSNDDGSIGDGARPPDKASTSCACNWAHILIVCLCPQLQPLKCTFIACNKLNHQHSQNAFEQRDGHSKTTLLKCCVHHSNSPFTASKPTMSNADKECEIETASSSNSSEEEDNAATPSHCRDSSSSSSEVKIMLQHLCIIKINAGPI